MTTVHGMNFLERLNNEVAKDLRKFKVWMSRMCSFVCASAHRADVRLEPFLKILTSSKNDVPTKELFREWKGTDLVMAKRI